MIVKSGRFGDLNIEPSETISVPAGILGFCEETDFCLVDPNDDTLILWLQSLRRPDFAVPCLEPKIFKPDYAVRLSLAEMRELELLHLNDAAVFCLLTIPEDITQMSANLKAPVVINLKNQKAKQVVLQENDYSVKHPIFKELRAHLMTIQSNRRVTEAAVKTGPVNIGALKASNMLRML